MKYSFRLLLIIAIAIFALSCSYFSKGEVGQEEEVVIIDDGYTKNNSKNEIIIDETDFEGKEIDESGSKETVNVPIRVMKDGSKVVTMFDTFGNKSETRLFDNHPRLRQIILQTSAEGEKTVLVYGQNGEVKDLPKEMVDRVLATPANAVADAAQITKIKTEQYRPETTQTQPRNFEKLNPLPSSAFEVQAPNTENINSVRSEPTGQENVPPSKQEDDKE